MELVAVHGVHSLLGAIGIAEVNEAIAARHAGLAIKDDSRAVEGAKTREESV